MNNNVRIKFFPKSKKVRIYTTSDKFYPRYLKYLLEYLKIPSGIKIQFNDMTIEEGIDLWLQNNPNKEKF